MAPEDREREPLDVLRRRLYRPGATVEDVDRYRALVVEVPATEAALPEEGAPPARRDRVRRLVVGLAAVAAAGVVATGLAVTSGRTTSLPAGAGRATVRPVPTPTTYAVDDGPSDVLVDGTGATGERYHGVGPAGVGLGPGAGRSGGRLVVAAASSAATHLPWSAGRPAFLDGSMPQHIVATGTAVREDQVLQPDVVAFDGAPPTWLVVEAPQHVSWTLTVVLLPPKDARSS